MDMYVAKLGLRVTVLVASRRRRMLFDDVASEFLVTGYNALALEVPEFSNVISGKCQYEDGDFENVRPRRARMRQQQDAVAVRTAFELRILSKKREDERLDA